MCRSVRPRRPGISEAVSSLTHDPDRNWAVCPLHGYREIEFSHGILSVLQVYFRLNLSLEPVCPEV